MKYSVLFLGLAWINTSSAGQINFNTWYEFSFLDVNTPAMGCFPADPNAPECIPSSGTPSVFADAFPWTFTVPSGVSGAVFTVTDVFFHGDAFTISGLGLPNQTTPAVPADFVSCGDDPVPCLADPLTSKGVFLSADTGTRSVTITPYASPYGGGVAYFRVDIVPEPASSSLVLAGLVIALAVWRMRVYLRS